MLCATGTNDVGSFGATRCFPAWPRFSPDGSKIAYVRHGAVSQLMAFSVADGKEWPLGSIALAVPAGLVVPQRSLGVRRISRRLRLGGKGDRDGPANRASSASRGQSERRSTMSSTAGRRTSTRTSPFFRKLRVETEETSPSSVSCGSAHRLRRSAVRCRAGSKTLAAPAGATSDLAVAFAFAMLDPGESSRATNNSGERNPLEHGFPLWFRGCGFETDAPHLRRIGRTSRGATSAPWGKHLISTA